MQVEAVMKLTMKKKKPLAKPKKTTSAKKQEKKPKKDATAKKPKESGAFPCSICGEGIPAIRREIFPHIDYCVRCSDRHHLTPTILADDVCDSVDVDTDFR